MNSHNSSAEQYASDSSKEQLISDFKVVMNDAEELLKATANHGDAKVNELRAKAKESLRVVSERIAQSQEALLAQSKKAAKATDAYVHDNPWASLGVAAGIGLTLGLLLRRS